MHFALAVVSIAEKIHTYVSKFYTTLLKLAGYVECDSQKAYSWCESSKVACNGIPGIAFAQGRLLLGRAAEFQLLQINRQIESEGQVPDSTYFLIKVVHSSFSQRSFSRWHD